MNISAQTTEGAVLPDATHIGRVALTVADLERMLQFYTEVLGFKLLERGEGIAKLGADSVPLLVLHEQVGAPPKPRRSTGLYHFAILVPSRLALARQIRQLADSSYPISGASDHAVSEALYLDDPEGNGIEIYRDRPRAEWRWQTATVQMALDPLDFDGILRELEHDDQPWTGLNPDTIIGHVHLHIGDIAAALRFYNGVLGFDVTAQMSGALFVSAGGYHHHLGLNIWAGRNAPPPPPGSAGLRHYEIQVPDYAAIGQLVARLHAEGIAFDQQDGALTLQDPWQNGIIVTSAS